MRALRVWLALVVIGMIAGALWWWLRPVRAEVTVYFLRPAGTGTTLQGVTRTVVARGHGVLVAAALQALIAGPNDGERARGLTSAIPSRTRLRGVQVQDGIVRADFSSDVEAGGGSSSMLGRFWQIVYTATQFTPVPRVWILIDGQTRTAMGGEGVVIDHPVGRPSTVPTF